MEVSINTVTPPILLEASASFPVLDGQPLLTQVGWTRVLALPLGRMGKRPRFTRSRRGPKQKAGSR